MNYMNTAQLLEVFIVATVISYLVSPVLQKIAFRTGYLDRPKSNKVHAHPIPLLGGVGIFISFFTVITLSGLRSIHYAPAIFLGCLILLCVGLIDDKFGMMPNIKLLGQFLAVMLVVKSGLRVDFLGNYYVNVIFTYIWIMGITNSFNLLDNMNGLSAGIAGISALAFAAICALDGQTYTAGFALAIAGASIGFLKHNFPKARIFMGDSGSMILGYLLAVLAILSSWQTRQVNPSLIVPFLVLSYPIFDTLLVTVIRSIEKRSIFEGGKDHSSHRLALLGLKKFKAVLIIYLLCVVSGVFGIIVSKSNIYTAVIAIAVSSFLFLILGVRLSLIKTYQHGRKQKHAK